MSESVLRRVAEGDEAAVKDVMDQFGGLVWSLARRSCPTAADAEDATQEIFLEIWKSAHRFDASKGSETLFVAMIARRRLIDRIRKQSREPYKDSIDEPGMQLTQEGADRWAETCAEASLAAQAVAMLKPQQKLVLEMGLLRGLSHSEIAAATGMPLGTVKTQMRRGLIKVREIMNVPPPGTAPGGEGA